MRGNINCYRGNYPRNNLDRAYGDREPPGQLAILRSLVDTALRSPVKWCQSFPLIDIVAV
ncbi:MAG: hypothetical protein AB4426_26005 [Xenococcaceae cyanobacterium]